MSEWSEGNYEIMFGDGRRTIKGLVSGEFGIHFDEHRIDPGWIVTHMRTGMSINGWQPFDGVDSAKEFVARVRPLADWKDVDLESPPDVASEIDAIVDELKGGDPLADLMRVPPYVGDDAFRAFLREHGCSTSLEVIRLRFLGAAVSPGREADVYELVEDLFDYQMPELGTQEFVAFLQAFLGLFQEVEQASLPSSVSLSPMGPVDALQGVEDLLTRRHDEIVFGFLEGVWQEDDELPLSGPQAAMLTVIEEAARTYDVRLFDIFDNEEAAKERPVTDWLRDIAEIDQAIETAMTSLLEAFRNDRSTDRALMMRADALIYALSIRGALPRDEIRQCIARRDEMVPIFLNILRDHAAGRFDIDDRDFALFVIIHILGEWGEQRAFAPLMDMLAGEPERVEEALGDAVTENLSQILISIFDGDTERLYKLMNNPDAAEYVRFAAFEAWTYHVAAGSIDRAPAERYLSSAFEKLQPQEENLVWFAWVEAIGHLGFTDLRATVRHAYESGLIPTGTISFSEFEKILDAASRSDDLVAFIAKDRIAPFSDTITVLSDWHAFSEEYVRANARAEREPRSAVSPRRAGTHRDQSHAECRAQRSVPVRIGQEVQEVLPPMSVVDASSE